MSDFLKNYSIGDILFFIITAVLVVRGFIRGFSGEFGGFLGLASAVAVVFFGSSPISMLVRGTGWGKDSPLLADITVFAVVLVLAIAAWLQVAYIAKRILKSVFGQPFDAILGGVIGGAKAVAVLALCCSLGWLSPVRQTIGELTENSTLVKTISQTVKPDYVK